MKYGRPISAIELLDKIRKEETELTGEVWNFWKLIQTEPQKWAEPELGNEGGGFWVVGICGRRIIWYNDIEEGFNISTYTKFGKIDEYFCNQDELNWAVMELYRLIKRGGEVQG